MKGKHFIKKTSGLISRKVALSLLSATLVMSLATTSPTLSKYVLEPISYVITMTSAAIFNVTPVTAIGPIAGTTAAGNILTAGAITPSGATVTYQWKKSLTFGGTYVDIQGATFPTYLLTNDDNNYYLKVTATGTGDFNGNATSSYVGPVIAATTPITAIGPITGTLYDGSPLTAGALTPSAATATYQWQRSYTVNGTYTDIAGATSSTYTPIADDVDFFMKVLATGSGSYTYTVSAVAGPVKNSKTPLASIGNISGSTIIGNTLSAGALSPSGATVTYQWLSCATPNGIYSNINGATSASYVLTENENGKYIKVIATGSDFYTGSVSSAYTGPVAAASIPVTAISNITGTPQVGQTLAVGALTPAEATATYQWQIASSVGGPYSNISGAVSTTYTLLPSDFGKFIKVVATGSGTYSGSITSNATSAVAAAPLTAIGNISGSTLSGSVLTAGTVEPLGATVTYQWLSSTTYNGTYTNISGATSGTYTISVASGSYIKVSATGTGSYSGTVTSAYTGPVYTGTGTTITAIAPISGLTQVNGTLTAGSLSPYAATATYQWQRSDTPGGTYTNISGATSKSYIAAPGDKGYYIRVIAYGSGSYTGSVISTPADPITAAPIINIAAIQGTAQVGETLSAGVLTPLNATATYQWARSETPYGTYIDVPGATGSSYDLTNDDNTRYLKVTATGTGSYLGTVTSEYTGPVTTTATTLVSISAPTGNPQIGQTGTVGTLSPAGATATYQWQRSDTAEGPFEDIIGATESTITSTEADYGHWFRVVATGSGVYSGTVTSPAVGPLQAATITSISNIAGTTAIGSTLTAGTTVPYGATVTYQWQRSDTSGGTYTDISGATSSTYPLTIDDTNYYIKVKVTGTNAYTGTVYSAYTGPVVDPSMITGMGALSGAISGTAQVGQTLTAGALSPPGATATYQWMRATTIDGTYSDISGATSNSYVIPAADYNYFLKVVATGSGSYQGTATSPATGPVQARPITAIGATSGTTTSGQILTAGTLTPLGATASYQWMRSDAWDGVYTDISGALSNTYTLAAGDIGYFLKVVATGSGAYSGSVTSAYTGPVSATVTPITAIGAISGTARVEEILTAGALSPSGATATYQWQRSTNGTDYTNITGATAATYKLVAADYNKYIRVVAKGSGIYSGTVNSTSTGLVAPCPLSSISSIGGIARVSNTLTAGTLLPIGATASYQWTATTGGNKAYPNDPYTAISGATSSTYIVSVATGNYIKVTATGTGAYTGTVTSTYIGPVTSAGAGIDITAISPITGSTQVGGTLSAGVLSPSAATATYQWQRSLTVNGTYADIPGANSLSYTTTSSDRDQYIKVIATGSGYYTNEVISSAAGPITPIPIISMASISGTTITGNTLAAGSLAPYAATASYQWKRSDTPDGIYTNIIGAVAGTYKLTTADTGKYIKVTATGTGAYSGTFTSSATGPVSATATSITAISPITGTAQVRQQLTAGTVTPGGASVTYQWQRSTDGINYTNISGASFISYTLTAADYGKTVRVLASGSGVYTGTVASTATGAVTACPITAIDPINGSAKEGELLTAGQAYPLGALVTYQWQQATWSGGTFSNIAGATSNTYLIPDGAAKNYIRVAITGTNGYTGTVTSASIGEVVKQTPGNPHPLIPITAIGPITGTNQVGSTLTSGALTPAGAAATYQWQRSSTPEGTYQNIDGATTNSYVLAAGDSGYFFKVRATGTNEYKGTVLSSSSNQVVTSFTPVTAVADILGTTTTGSTLTAGAVTPAAATVSYAWLISDTSGGTYAPIAGAASSTYVVAAGDTGKYLKVQVTGTGAYNGTVLSNYAGPVAATATEITAIGPITGSLVIGQTITAGALTPAGATATYQWQICTEPGGLFANISGATSSSYTLTLSEYNYYIRVIATGSGIYTGTVEATTAGKVVKIEITGFDALSDINGGTTASPAYSDAAAVAAALPNTVFANSSTVSVPVTSWADTDTYNPSAAGSYTFTAVLGEIPADYTNTGGYTATVEVVISE